MITKKIGWVIAMLVFVFAKTNYVHAQNKISFSSKVVDASTQKVIPFATVQYAKDKGLITNDEGVFTINYTRNLRVDDTLHISSLGYEGLDILPQEKDSVIFLEPKPFELKGVFLSDNPLTPEQIIKKVRENLETNYNQGFSSKKIFFRQSLTNTNDKFKITCNKSSIDAINQKFIDSVINVIPNQAVFYREAAGNFYGSYKDQKFEVQKSAELFDLNQDASIEALVAKFEKIFSENVKDDSYFKIKSGLLGTKITMDSLKKLSDAPKNSRLQAERKTNPYFKLPFEEQLGLLYEQTFLSNNAKTAILRRPNRYKFTLEDYTYINDEPVYIINFTPKGNKDFKGKVYVNMKDFGIFQMEYENTESLRKFGLLGITYRHIIYKGKMLYRKTARGIYEPQYFSLEDGAFFGVDRPLRVIEKNKNVKGRRKQNEISLDMDAGGTSITKYELVIFQSKDITKTQYKSVDTSVPAEPTFLKRYDPNFWKGYTIMEPNTAIQTFGVVK